jgi:hypothetical protein
MTGTHYHAQLPGWVLTDSSLPGVAWNYNPPDLSLSCSWDYKHGPLVPGSQLTMFKHGNLFSSACSLFCCCYCCLNRLCLFLLDCIWNFLFTTAFSNLIIVLYWWISKSFSFVIFMRGFILVGIYWGFFGNCVFLLLIIFGIFYLFCLQIYFLSPLLIIKFQLIQVRQLDIDPLATETLFIVQFCPFLSLWVDIPYGLYRERTYYSVYIHTFYWCTLNFLAFLLCFFHVNPIQ